MNKPKCYILLNGKLIRPDASFNMSTYTEVKHLILNRVPEAKKSIIDFYNTEPIENKVVEGKDFMVTVNKQHVPPEFYRNEKYENSQELRKCIKNKIKQPNLNIEIFEHVYTRIPDDFGNKIYEKMNGF